MNHQLGDDSAAGVEERRYKNVSVKRIVEIEALWRINAENDSLLLEEAEAATGTWKLAA
ncbi:MAG TPA: hypothetical protein VFQ02_00650 [Nitrospira sp.]|nr:hypothetical protein [Nitrospira sp.]